MSDRGRVVGAVDESEAPSSLIASWIEAIIALGIVLATVRSVAWMYQFPEGGLGLGLALACTAPLLALFYAWQKIKPRRARRINGPSEQDGWSTRKKFIYALGLGLIFAFGVEGFDKVQDPVIDFSLKAWNFSLIAIIAPINSIVIFFSILERDW